MTDLEELLSHTPADDRVLGPYVNALILPSMTERGWNALRRGLEILPGDTDLHDLVARFAQRTQDPSRAIALLEPLLGVVPDPALLLCRIGNQRMDAGQFERADADFRRALDHAPRLPWAHARRGDVAFALNQRSRAREHWERAIECDPDYAWPHRRLFELHQQDGDADAVWATLERWFRAMPDSDADFHLQEEAVRRGLADQFAELVHEVLPRVKSKAELWTRLAHAFLEAKRLNEALRSVDQAIEENARYAWAHSKRGDVLGRMGKTKDAIAAYEASLQIDPTDQWSMSRVFELRGKKDAKGARAWLLEAMQFRPNDGWLFGRLLAEAKSKKKAAALAEELLAFAQQNPDSCEALLHALRADLQAGNTDRAETTSLEACRRFPRSVRSWQERLDLLHERSRWKELAIAALESIHSAEPTRFEFVEKLLLHPQLPSQLRTWRVEAFAVLEQLRHCADRDSAVRCVEQAAHQIADDSALHGLSPQTLVIAAATQVPLRQTPDPADLEHLCTLFPNSLPLIYLRAVERMRAGEHEGCLDDLRRVAQNRDRDDMDRVEIMTAHCQAGLGRWDEFERTVKLYGDRLDNGRYWVTPAQELAETVFLYHCSRRRWRAATQWWRRRRRLGATAGRLFVLSIRGAFHWLFRRLRGPD